MGTSARDRKRKQRTLAKSAGRKRIELTLPSSITAPLQETLGPFAGDLAHELEAIIRIELPRHVKRLRELTLRAGPLWLAADRLGPFSQHLSRPGIRFRVHDREYNSDEWLRVQAELAQLVGALANLGWPQKRIRRFLRFSASLVKTEPLKCQVTGKTNSQPPPMT